LHSQHENQEERRKKNKKVVLVTNYVTINDTCRLKRNKMPQLFQQHDGRRILVAGYAAHAT
jgi:hypothetical protein